MNGPPFLLGATTLGKDLLLNRLEIPLPGPGYIHIGGPERGFDKQRVREMTAERKETVFRAGIQKTVWRRLSNREITTYGISVLRPSYRSNR